MATPQQKSNREHSFDAELASLVGIEKAILLKNIDYWVGENERRKIDSSFAYGKWWTFESLTSLAKKYPYMRRGNLSRWFSELKRDKWIIMYSTTDGANMYRPGPVFTSWNLGQDWQVVFQNETGRTWGAVFQNEPKAVFQNETEGAAHFETDNNVEKHIEKNVEREGEREVEKAPAPETYDEFMDRVNSEAAEIRAFNEAHFENRRAEAENKKSSPVAANPLTIHSGFNEVFDAIYEKDENGEYKIRRDVEPSLPVGFDVEIHEPVKRERVVLPPPKDEPTTPLYQPTNPDAAKALLAKMGKSQPKDPDAAQNEIRAWVFGDGSETVRVWYEKAKRKDTPEDRELICVEKFCSVFALSLEPGRRMLFENDPLYFFQKRGYIFILDECGYDRKREQAQPKNGFAQPVNQSAENRTGMYRKITDL